MKLPEPAPKNFSSIMSEIENGQIKIPQFQRNFVWDIIKSSHLMDSIIKGYPIGTFIFWRTKERLRSIRNIGGIDLPEPQEGEFVDFVLDGQQRITTIFACLKGLKIERESGKEVDYSEIYVDLEASEDEQIVITDTSDMNVESIISLHNLLYGKLELLSKYPEKYEEKLDEYKIRIVSYTYSTIQVKEAPIEVATEIFTRVNVGGEPLSLFEIMVAKTFDVERDFDLAEKYNRLVENLSNVNYETISDASVLQVISILIKKECKRKVILNLDKHDFIDKWDDAEDAIEKAVEYFKSSYRIPVSKLLPYNSILVPFSYFFYQHKNKPTGNMQKYLQDYFWRCSLTGRFSSGVEGKLAQDVKKIDEILKEELPTYDWSVDTSKKFIIDNGWFSAGRSYIKAILCIYAYHQPKSFNDNSIVNINNDWLKRANSKNYHHFFPKQYLQNRGEDGFYINHILNITIVDDFLNKREIRAKAPSDYMKKFRKQNKDNLEDTMKTHLILDLDKFGIWNNDYDKFFEERAKTISKELQKRIIEQDIDKEPQPALIDVLEETETE